jgi:hypothetical protein
MTTTDDRPPGLPPGLGGLIASVTRPGAPTVAAEATAPGLGIFAAPAAAETPAGHAWTGTVLGGAGPAAPPARTAAPETAGPTFDSVTEQRTEWLWPGRIPLADVTLFFGTGAIGKGRMLCSIIASVTRGLPVGTSTEAGEAGDVIVVFPEDKPDEQVVPRLRAAGADLSRVHDMTRLESGSRFKLSAAEKQDGHIAHLRAAVEELREAGRNPRLIVIDPLAAVVGWGSIATNPGARRVVEPLQDLADVTGVAVLLVGHTTKAGILQGSAGLMQALRWVYRVAVDPVNTAFRVITTEKANNQGPGIPDIRFTIAEDGTGTPRVEWLDRAALAARRQGWRDQLAARRQAQMAHAPTSLPASNGLQAADPPADATPPPAPAAAAARFAAAWAIRIPGGQPEAHTIPGEWPTLEAAQGVCQASARAPLAWKQSATRPGTWTASVPPGPGGAEVSYAVSAAAGT